MNNISDKSKMIILTVPHNINKYCPKVVRVYHNNRILKDSDIKGPDKCTIRFGIVENGKKGVTAISRQFSLMKICALNNSPDFVYGVSIFL